VDGRPAALGDELEPSRNVVTLDGRRVRPPAGAVTLVLNKPSGVITTMRDERGRTSVASLLPPDLRLFPVGRLDAETTGLLVCTNDGDLAQFLLAPKNALPRTYRVTVRGSLDAQTAETLGARQVGKREDGTSAFTLSLHEGRNRQVRRMCARLGLRVVGLCRTQFGPISLGKLKAGCTRELTFEEARELDTLRTKRQAL
jgi:23S rRNA pseudouridine2605 synthase